MAVTGVSVMRVVVCVTMLLLGMVGVVRAQRMDGSVWGEVVDGTGAAVPGAAVELVREGGGSVHGVSGEDGSFRLEGVGGGRYELRVERAGFAEWHGGAEVVAGQPLAMGEVALRVSGAEAVEVRASARDVAEAQMQMEERQRVLGVFPNFYASYARDAEPLTAGEKFRLARRFAVDPVAFAMAGLMAGSEQRARAFPGYGPGAAGYGKRLGAAYTDGLTSTMLGQAFFPALLRQDPRFFVKQTGSVGSRLLYALASAVLCKGDNRRWQVNYSNVMGNFASAGLSNAYYPAGSRGVGLVVGNALTATAMGAVGGLFQEFLLRRMTPGVVD